MTNEEAIKIIYHLGIKGSQDHTASEIAKALTMAIEALEKQIPKKPEKLNYEPLIADGWVYKCPTCGCACGINRYYGNITQDDEYCTQCGQKLEIIWD